MVLEKLLNKQKIALNKYIANPNASNKKVLIEMNDEFLEIIGNENTYGLLSAPLANFKGSNVFLSEFKFTSPSLKKLDTTGIFKGKNIKDLNLLEQVILDFNRPLKKVDDKGSLIKGKGKLLTNKQFVSQFEDTIEGPLDASIDYLVNRKTVKTDPFFRAQQKTYLQQNPGKNSDDAIELLDFVKFVKETYPFSKKCIKPGVEGEEKVDSDVNNADGNSMKSRKEHFGHDEDSDSDSEMEVLDADD